MRSVSGRLFVLCTLVAAVAAVARAACPSVAACEQHYVPCSNTSLAALDPDLDDGYNDTIVMMTTWDSCASL